MGYPALVRATVKPSAFTPRDHPSDEMAKLA
jgi:hypothetical protein